MGKNTINTFTPRHIPDLTKGEKIKISYSKIHLFHDCPRQYFYRYLTDLKIKPTIYPGNLIGQVFHNAMEQTVKMKNENKSDQEIIISLKGRFEELYAKKVEENKSDYRVSRELSSKKDTFFKSHDRMMIQIVKFVLSYFFQENVKIVSEQSFDIVWDWDHDVIVTGVLDLQLQYDVNRIVDLKITKDSSTYYFVNWVENIQDLMYEYYSWKTFGVLPASFSYLVFNREEGTLFFKEKKIVGNIEFESYFKYLHDEIQKLKAFILNPDMELVNPSESKCRWCVYSNMCTFKYESENVRKFRKTLKR